MGVAEAKRVICDKNAPIAKKMRALFYLMNVKTDEAVAAIADGFTHTSSVLFKHEAAYVLGQMGLLSAIPYLINVLRNEDEDEIVRHEAGDALGNLGCITSGGLDKNASSVLALLREYIHHPKKPIRETCYVACKKIESRKNLKSKFGSYDPASPMEGTLEEARRILLDPSECLYRRYAAMFFLRDLGTEDAVKALGEGMKDESALFKHEISFIFGQMRDRRAMPYLIAGVENENEHGMVRHECAEALGILGDEEAKEALLKFEDDPCDILKESVEVAIDIHKYITGKDFEYCVVE